MAHDTSDDDVIECLNCGFAAPIERNQWESVEHIALGEIPECPECESTMTTALSEA